MDFLKTILAYVTLLTTLGVQEGPAPQTVPTPSPLPAHVTASPVPHQTAAPTATPAPTPDPTPAMTANKRYAKLAFGDSGTNVRKLQNALIKLGYMPSGSADSQYGYQTLNAVKAFQRANGLSADGVAGPITLTHLYENPAVIGVTVATEVPTATPTPPLPSLPTMDPASAAAQQAPAALLTRMEGAYVISGADGKTLYYETQVNDVPALVKLDMWVDAAGTPVLSLPQLAGALGWNLMGSAADGLYALHACGGWPVRPACLRLYRQHPHQGRRGFRAYRRSAHHRCRCGRPPPGRHAVRDRRLPARCPEGRHRLRCGREVPGTLPAGQGRSQRKRLIPGDKPHTKSLQSSSMHEIGGFLLILSARITPRIDTCPAHISDS